MRTIPGLLTVILLACSSAAAAQAPPQAGAALLRDVRVAYFSPQRAFAESSTGKAARTRLLSLQEEKSKEIESRARRLEAQRAALQQTATVLDSSARLAREQDIERFQLDLQRFTEDAQAEFLGVRTEAENTFLTRLRPALDSVAREKGLLLVIDGDAVPILWADPSLDITRDIVVRLDQP